MNGNAINPDELITNFKKMGRMAKVCLVFGIIFAVVALIGVFLIFNDDPLSFVFIMAGGVFSLMFFIIFLAKILKSKNRLKNINFDELKSEIAYTCVPYNGFKTYFTQNYMLSNYYYAFVIKYTDIVWIYRMESKNQYGMTMAVNLMIFLKNGKKEYTHYEDKFVDEIASRNPNIIIGYSRDNKKMYKEIVKQNKQ